MTRTRIKTLMMTIRIPLAFSLFLLALTASAEVPGIHLADKSLGVEFLDSDEKEFFISQTMDLYPTLLELTGCKQQPQQTVDGHSLVPLIRGEKKKLKRPFLAWWYPHANGHGTQPCQAILKDGWKLVHWMNQNETELFHLDEDEGERNDLAKKEPKKACELLETLNQWVKETGRSEKKDQ